jgi:hypothetical protein
MKNALCQQDLNPQLAVIVSQCDQIIEKKLHNFRKKVAQTVAETKKPDSCIKAKPKHPHQTTMKP